PLRLVRIRQECQYLLSGAPPRTDTGGDADAVVGASGEADRKWREGVTRACHQIQVTHVVLGQTLGPALHADVDGRTDPPQYRRQLVLDPLGQRIITQDFVAAVVDAPDVGAKKDLSVALQVRPLAV